MRGTTINMNAPDVNSVTFKSLCIYACVRPDRYVLYSCIALSLALALSLARAFSLLYCIAAHVRAYMCAIAIAYTTHLSLARAFFCIA